MTNSDSTASASDSELLGTLNNSSSVQDSVERNREYFENLRKIYEPDPTDIGAQVIPERSRSEESTPDLKKEVFAAIAKKVKLTGKSKEFRKLIRRRTSPGFFYQEPLELQLE